MMVLMLAAFLTIVQAAGVGSAQSEAPLIKAAGLEISSVEDSGSYLLYRYRLINSLQSRAAITTFHVDLSASPGTGLVMLPSTGEALHMAPISIGKITDHVPVGIVSPDGWTAALLSNGLLSSFPFQGYVGEENGAAVTITKDSAPPGGSKTGFGLRSPYLPGLRRFFAEPTLGSCCVHVKPGTGEYPSQLEFRATGTTVAPTVRPDRLTAEIVRSDLEQICGSLCWISDDALCERLRSTLEKALSASRRGDGQNAKQALTTLIQDLNTSHDVAKSVNDNAYWLLKVNAEYLASQM